MLRALGAIPVICLAVGCGVGGTNSDGIMPGDDGTEDILCTAALAITGSFTAPAPLDPAGGCQPTGTWTMTVTVADQGNCSAVPLKSSYVYTVTGEARQQTISYSGTATGETTQLRIGATGSGDCEGSFEHILPDADKFDQLSLHPILPEPTTATTTATLGGQGEFSLLSKRP